ncbi:hypothetical protein A1F94_007908 [Pyrenophora tritici-repentis]|uniref:Uncharacterized protein n=2 Tax=Pyrenophora tritici-repentis TaxID=45151 RepID=A0A317A0F5_9PLEO|nr:uncharacterized protein PTRG_11932 [Pyrenophora tritici-repentis Pt-1C-BFP]KAA8617307.1 hypothetical protein PtrV1_10608 [Pyrenophora tritici-repentis]EDU46131.1 hypothetical protein PTRG_11932 [Pyrenophora tritici-repentis Pt-1C-BFP]KAF7567671.1 hypothetical protein PtrM4_142620 [Pyrenophora tritici-repentis]KAG9382254.1 hypothetical protein A1F94_007908 [Pyrenophora tritici-repentis]KAI0569564.1 hypothetical protein Alg130_11590 [Pyrenophora tritici-repentis]
MADLATEQKPNDNGSYENDSTELSGSHHNDDHSDETAPRDRIISVLPPDNDTTVAYVGSCITDNSSSAREDGDNDKDHGAKVNKYHVHIEEDNDGKHYLIFFGNPSATECDEPESTSVLQSPSAPGPFKHCRMTMSEGKQKSVT